MISYNNKKFKSLSASKNSEITNTTIFDYSQKGNVLTCNYSGDNIITGNLIGLVENDGSINMRYHQISKNGELMTGICFSKPEITSNGKIRLYETWQWTSGDKTKGSSVLEEI